MSDFDAAKKRLEEAPPWHAEDVRLLLAEVERLVREKADLEMDRGMLKAVHGVLVDAGCRMGEIGKCEADLVRGLSSEVERLRSALIELFGVVAEGVDLVPRQRFDSAMSQARAALRGEGEK